MSGLQPSTDAGMVKPAIQYARQRVPELLVWMGIPLLGTFSTGESISLGRFVIFVLALTAAVVIEVVEQFLAG